MILISNLFYLNDNYKISISIINLLLNYSILILELIGIFIFIW